ncbi:MAG: multidrug ABC transporter permease [Alkalinema sp. CACIAM 70d]|nr:MAG: multidrug ABC transporter permease [Alkalinema sp. CACIAM 70d]
MKRLYKIFQTLLSTYYAYMLEYRAELLLWALSGCLPIILMGVWTQAAQGGAFALTSAQFARYFLAIFLCRQLTVVWVIWEFEREIVEGKLAFRLLQPLDPVWHHVWSHIGERFARLPFIAVIIGLFILLYPSAFWIPDAGTLALFILVSICAFALQFLIQYTFAMFAFWTEKASAIQELWFLFHLFLSGSIAPLEVFPPGVRQVVEFLPFPYILHFPASILTGLPVDYLRSFLIMGSWAGIFYAINRYLWRKGLKQFSGMGA